MTKYIFLKANYGIGKHINVKGLGVCKVVDKKNQCDEVGKETFTRYFVEAIGLDEELTEKQLKGYDDGTSISDEIVKGLTEFADDLDAGDLSEYIITKGSTMLRGFKITMFVSVDTEDIDEDFLPVTLEKVRNYLDQSFEININTEEYGNPIGFQMAFCDMKTIVEMTPEEVAKVM